MRYSPGFNFLIIIVIIVTLGTLSALGWVLFGPHLPKSTNSTQPVTQGVRGIISVRSGDCMPTIGGESTCHTGPNTTPTSVIIKQSTSQTDKTQKRVVSKIDNVTDSFETELAPGLYNMYVMVGGKEYCNLYGGQNGEDCEFTVLPGSITPYSFQINNAAD